MTGFILKLTTAGAIVLGVLLFNTICAAAAQSDVDARFLAALRSAGIIYETPEVAITAGHAVCQAIDTGEAPVDVAKDIMAHNPIDGNHAGYFVGASISAYCPQH